MYMYLLQGMNHVECDLFHLRNGQHISLIAWKKTQIHGYIIIVMFVHDTDTQYTMTHLYWKISIYSIQLTTE